MQKNIKNKMKMRICLAPAFCAAYALFFLGLHFYKLGLAPFILDEPYFQLLVDSHFRNGTFPTAALTGNSGLPYGPTAIIFYWFTRLFTDQIETVVAAHVVVLVIGMLLLTGLMKKAFRADWRSSVVLWPFMLMSSSPILFFYSRLAWDNTLFIPLTAGTLFLTLHLKSIGPETKNTLFVLWGACLGLLFSLHLMGLPFVVTMVFFIFPPKIKKRGFFLKPLGFSLFGFLAVSIGYLPKLMRSLQNIKYVSSGEQSFYEWFPKMEVVFSTVSTRVMSYFYGPLFSGLFVPALDLGSVLMVLCFAVLVYQRFFEKKKLPDILIISIYAAVATLIQHFFMRVDLIHPHYFNPLWFLHFIVLASALFLGNKIQKAVVFCVAGFVLFQNAFFVVQSLKKIQLHEGTREMHYGTTLQEQRRFIEEACLGVQRNQTSVLVLDRSQLSGVFSYSLQYHFDHVSACSGLRLSWNQQTGNVVYGENDPLSARLKMK